VNRKADFYKTNSFESIRIKNRVESIRIANWNALPTGPRRARGWWTSPCGGSGRPLNNGWSARAIRTISRPRPTATRRRVAPLLITPSVLPHTAWPHAAAARGGESCSVQSRDVSAGSTGIGRRRCVSARRGGLRASCDEIEWDRRTDGQTDRDSDRRVQDVRTPETCLPWKSPSRTSPRTVL